jgi:5-methylcytosine-specific restriction endonuclease McrA
MKLTHLTDKTLLNDTKVLTQRERKITLELLWHLKEIETRRLFSDLKYGSLFDYCTRELGYSEGSAQRRIVAARALRSMPEIEKKIESGALNLSTVGLVQRVLKNATIDEKRKAFEEIEFKTQNQVLEILKQNPLVEKKHSIEVDEETLQLIKELKSLKPDIDPIKVALKAAIAQAKKEKFKLTDKPKTRVIETKSRTPSYAIKRALAKRAEYKCQNCGSMYALQYDHRVPWARGGQTKIENIRLLCRNCNARSALQAGLRSKNRKAST